MKGCPDVWRRGLLLMRSSPRPPRAVEMRALQAGVAPLVRRPSGCRSADLPAARRCRRPQKIKIATVANGDSGLECHATGRRPDFDDVVVEHGSLLQPVCFRRSKCNQNWVGERSAEAVATNAGRCGPASTRRIWCAEIPPVTILKRMVTSTLPEPTKRPWPFSIGARRKLLDQNRGSTQLIEQT